MHVCVSLEGQLFDPPEMRTFSLRMSLLHACSENSAHPGGLLGGRGRGVHSSYHCAGNIMIASNLIYEVRVEHGPSSCHYKKRV